MCFKSAFLSRFVQSQLHIAKQPQTRHPRLTWRKKKYRNITGCCDTRAVNQVRQLKDSIGTFTGILYSCLSRCNASLSPRSTIHTMYHNQQLEQLDSQPPLSPASPRLPTALTATLPSHAMPAPAWPRLNVSIHDSSVIYFSTWCLNRL